MHHALPPVSKADRYGEQNLFLAWLRYDAVIVFALLLATWKFTSGLEHVRDIELGDESVYLTSGYKLASEGFRPRLASHLHAPLYTLWYFVLSQIERDPLALFYLNHRVQSAVISILLFLLLQRYNLGTVAGAGVAFAYLVSYGNVAILPRVSHVAVAVILTSMLLGTFLKTPLAKLCAFAIGALLASFARPELFLGFTLMLPWIVYRTYVAWSSSGFRSLLPPALLALLTLLLMASFGLPLGDSARSSVAFRQHFAFNWVALNNSDIPPWSEYYKIADDVFGDPNIGLAGAVLQNPGAVAMHAFLNLTQVPQRKGGGGDDAGIERNQHYGQPAAPQQAARRTARQSYEAELDVVQVGIFWDRCGDPQLLPRLTAGIRRPDSKGFVIHHKFAH